MNREMRRNDRQLNTEDTLSILEQGEYGILSTVSADGIPYGVPVSYTYFNQCIYFHCAKNAGLKLENSFWQRPDFSRKRKKRTVTEAY